MFDVGPFLPPAGILGPGLNKPSMPPGIAALWGIRGGAGALTAAAPPAASPAPPAALPPPAALAPGLTPGENNPPAALPPPDIAPGLFNALIYIIDSFYNILYAIFSVSLIC